MKITKHRFTYMFLWLLHTVCLALAADKVNDSFALELPDNDLPDNEPDLPGTRVKQSLTFELPDNEQTCFYQEFTGAHPHLLEFKVVGGGHHDVDLTLKAPNGKVLYKETKKESDVVKFDTSYGTYEFCFGNEFSTFTHKTIYFSLRPEGGMTLAEQGGDDRPTVNTHVEELLEHIHNTGLNVITYQTSYRLNEAKGRHAAEDLNKKVLYWSMFEAGVIFLTGVSQCLILKAFFSLQRSSIRDAATTSSSSP